MLRHMTESSETGEDAHPPIQQLLLYVRLPLHDLQLLLQPRSLLCHALKVRHPALLLVQPAMAVVSRIPTPVAPPCLCSPAHTNKGHLKVNVGALQESSGWQNHAPLKRGSSKSGDSLAVQSCSRWVSRTGQDQNWTASSKLSSSHDHDRCQEQVRIKTGQQAPSFRLAMIMIGVRNRSGSRLDSSSKLQPGHDHDTCQEQVKIKKGWQDPSFHLAVMVSTAFWRSSACSLWARSRQSLRSSCSLRSPLWLCRERHSSCSLLLMPFTLDSSRSAAGKATH